MCQLRFLMAILAWLATTAASASTLWLGSERELYRFDTFGNQAARVMEESQLGPIAAATEGEVWAVVGSRLSKIDGTGQSVTEVDLAQLRIENVERLLFEPHSQTLWVLGNGNRVWHLTGQGAVITVFQVGLQVRAAALAQDESIWIAGDGHVLNFSSNGKLVREVSLAPAVSDHPVQMVVDSLAAQVWIGSGRLLMRVEMSSGVVRAVDLPVEMASIVVEEKRGTVWVLGEDRLLAFDDRGRLVLDWPLEAMGVHEARALAVDPLASALWVSHSEGLSRLSGDGSSPEIGTFKGPSLNKLAAPAFWMAPRLELIIPTAAATDDSRPTFTLALDALCSGTPCGFGRELTDSFRLSASLDESDVSQELARPQPGIASYRPTTPLTSGMHRFGAVATDDFGHSSNRIAASIDVQARGSAGEGRDTESLKAKNAVPTIKWNAPSNGSSFPMGASITLSADASDSDGTISKVEFFQGATLIGHSASASNPYSLVWTAPGAGSYLLTAKATDDRGGSASTSAVTLTVNSNAPPDISVSSPLDGSTFTAPTALTFSASATDPDGTVASLDLYEGTTLLQHVAGTSKTVLLSYVYANASAGTHVFKLTATDNLGAASTRTIALSGNQAPSIVLLTPANCSAGAQPMQLSGLRAHVWDIDGAVTKVEFYQDGSLLGIADSKIGYEYTINRAINLPQPGKYVFTAKAYDNRGAVTTSAPISYYVDVPPTVTLISPVDGAKYRITNMVTLAADVSDADGTISEVSFWSDRSSQFPLARLTQPPYTAVVGTFSAGDYTITAKAKDNRGIVTTSTPVVIHILTNLPPTVSLTAPSDGVTVYAGTALTLSANASDPDGSVAKVEFLSDGSNQIGASLTAPPYTQSWTASLPTGSHTISARATDNAGASTVSAAVNLQVLAYPISFAITSPAAGATVYEDSVIVKGTFSGGAPTSITVNGQAVVIGNGSFAGTVPVSLGSNAIVVTLNSAAGSVSKTLSITRQAVSATISNVIDGQVIADDNETIRGHVNGPLNMAVTVNGRLASLDGDGNFFVNNLPLVTGENPLSIVVNTLDESTEQTVTVVRDGLAPFGFEVSPDSNLLAPATVTLTLENRALTPYSVLYVDANGDNQLDYYASAPASPVPTVRYQITYDQPGSYPLFVMIQDEQNRTIYTATRWIHVGKATQLGSTVVGVYQQLVDRLGAGDITGALRLYTSDSQDTYTEIFQVLGRSVSEVAQQLGTFTSAVIGEELAELTFVRETTEGKQSFMLYLIRGTDGVWRIDRM
jgi:hypothetical protein